MALSLGAGYAESGDNMNPKVEELLHLYFSSELYAPIRATFSDGELNWSRNYGGSCDALPSSEFFPLGPDESGYANWSPVDSPITANIITKMERCLDFKLPVIFAEFISFKCLPVINYGIGCLPSVDPDHPLIWLEWCLRIQEQPLFLENPNCIPFVHGLNGRGFLCFDTKAGEIRGDCPLVMLSTDFLDAEEPAKASHVAFPTLERYFDILILYLRYFNSGSWRETDYSTWLRDHGEEPPPKLYFYI
ncbi:hypothetical protein [Paludisphaera mucosa]|uniref:Knr4/Smi1-like domain-containing protein n=1 Tax=Paludisphaera mucosa TaxID=3030827 RepID=A0ABT6F4B7_9BACT|nr:hypothetical protein [Paludisphaera mucosa]MDG3002438.1 hypothetical protein [Paludisphaera mucosa]